MEKIIFAIPFFGFLIAVEFLYGYFNNKNTYADLKDAFSSLFLGILNVAVTFVVASVLLSINYFFYNYRIFDIGSRWYEMTLLFILVDFTYYWWHRASHRIRFLWANHVNHHSSQEFNFTTAFRQPFLAPVLRPFFYFYLPFIGFTPENVALIGVINLVWAVWSHTKHIGNLGWLEYIIVTPSSHRVHHGSNAMYIDKNYGGILIIWDKLFGTFEPEIETVTYEITNNINSYNPIKIIFHEWKAWLVDLKNSKSPKEAFDYTFKAPK